MCYSTGNMTLADNKKARFDYEILETFEAGLVLTGQEVKSAKNGQIDLKGAFIDFRGGKPFLVNARVSKYKQAGPLPDYDPERPRALLLRQKEINRLIGKKQEKGLTILPLKVYNKGRLVKMEIGVAKGRKTRDKREIIKKRDTDKMIKKELGGDRF